MKVVFKIMGKSEDYILAYKKVNERITDRKNEVPC